MKKTIFTALAVLLTLAIFSCDDISKSAAPEEDGLLTDVVYSADGSRVTIYLEGGVPVSSQSRALNKDLAKMGYDFYEVVFYSINESGVERVARTSWEIGQSAAVRGVPRVNYEMTIPEDPTIAPVTAEKNTAVIFVGRRSDRTLLGVGTLMEVATGSTVTPGGNVTDSVTSVTFSVLALDAGASAANSPDPNVTPFGRPAANSSYSNLSTMVVEKKAFPVFELNPFTAGTAENTEFTLGPRPRGTGFDETDSAHRDDLRYYFEAVRLIGDSNVELKYPPRYTTGGTTLELRAAYATATTAQIAPASLPANTAFPTTAINIAVTPGADSRADQQGLMALSFSIPVYAVTLNSSSDGNAALTWNIRPGFGTSWYDLDDGNDGQGGALLVSIGEIPSVIDVVAVFP